MNVALFGATARQWRDANPDLEGNMRDHATIEQLLALSNLESLNAEPIRMGWAQSERIQQLNKSAITQMQTLINAAQKLKRAAGEKKDPDDPEQIEK